jgi:hypothetical protein
MGKHQCQAPLNVAQILWWAERHRRHTGAWPTARSGQVLASSAETWAAVNMAMRQGLRGLPGGDTLSQLLQRERGLGERRGRPRVNIRQAIRLRDQGLSFAEIGRRLGVSRQAIFRKLRGLAG